MKDRHLDRKREEVMDAVRFLSPREAQRVLRECLDDIEKATKDYERWLE